MAVVLILGVFYYYRTSHLLQINSTLTKEKQHSIIQRHAPPFGLHVHIGKIHKLLECVFKLRKMLPEAEVVCSDRTSADRFMEEWVSREKAD